MSVEATAPNGQRPPVPPPQANPAATAAAAVTGAIRKAAQTTGASFDYLLATAKVESNLNPNLSMRSSSATGLFQFIEQTWLEVVKQAGKALGLGQYADGITQTRSGRYVVQDPALRTEIMKLRKDPAANATMGGVFTQQNAAVLGKRIGRKPTDGELYIAHFFGPYSAAKVIRAAGSNPTANAAQMFPAAARANRPIFYDKQGNARSVAGVYNELVRRYQVARASPTPGLTTTVAASEPAPAARAVTVAATTNPVAVTPNDPPPVRDSAGVTLAFAAATAAPPSANASVRPSRPAEETGSVFHSMFSTEGRRGAVSPVLAELWGGGRAPAEQSEPAPVPAKAGGAGSPLDLFQNMRPNVRGLFDGSA